MEKTKNRIITFRIDEEKYRRLKEKAKESGLSIADIIRLELIEGLKNENER
jgi:antitoxin component of RelBE/YafQ-DinJ toxin-antitoxin module